MSAELQHHAIGKLSTRESLIREIQERILSDLYSEPDGRTLLNGPLGEQIAIASGSWSLEFTTPEELAQGIANWLGQYFLQPSDHPTTAGAREATTAPQGVAR